MSMVSDKRITRRAYHLAHSGGYPGWLAIEQELIRGIFADALSVGLWAHP